MRVVVCYCYCLSLGIRHKRSGPLRQVNECSAYLAATAAARGPVKSSISIGTKKPRLGTLQYVPGERLQG